MGIMETKIDIRKFAVDKAITLLGAGTPMKDVVTKAKEIEAYIVEGIELPDDPDKAFADMFAKGMNLAMELTNVAGAESK